MTSHTAAHRLLAALLLPVGFTGCVAGTVEIADEGPFDSDPFGDPDTTDPTDPTQTDAAPTDAATDGEPDTDAQPSDPSDAEPTDPTDSEEASATDVTDATTDTHFGTDGAPDADGEAGTDAETDTDTDTDTDGDANSDGEAGTDPDTDERTDTDTDPLNADTGGFEFETPDTSPGGSPGDTGSPVVVVPDTAQVPPIGETGEPAPDRTDLFDTALGDANTRPALSSIDIDDGDDALEIQVVATDPNRDLPGGSVRLTVEGDITTYAIDADLEDWNWIRGSGTGTAELTWPYDACDTFGTTLGLSLRVFDAAGFASAAFDDAFPVPGVGARVPEVGDLWGAYFDIGEISGNRAAVCGGIHTVNIDGNLADRDWTRFTPLVSGLWTVELIPNERGDYQLDVLDAAGFNVGRDYQGGLGVPETLQVTLTSGQTYYFLVWGSSGATSSWTVRLTGP
jgi:hypothetical protein